MYQGHQNCTAFPVSAMRERIICAFNHDYRSLRAYRAHGTQTYNHCTIVAQKMVLILIKGK